MIRSFAGIILATKFTVFVGDDFGKRIQQIVKLIAFVGAAYIIGPYIYKLLFKNAIFFYLAKYEFF